MIGIDGDVETAYAQGLEDGAATAARVHFHAPPACGAELGSDMWTGDSSRVTCVDCHRADARKQALAEAGEHGKQLIADVRADERERIRRQLLDGDPCVLEARFREFVDDEEAADCALVVRELLAETS